MRLMACVLGVMILGGVGVGVADPHKQVDWNARAKAVTWSLDHEANILDWARNVSGYDVVMIHEGANGSFGDLKLRIEKAGKAKYKFDAHEETPLIVDGDTLYYSEHSPISNGATIVKVDLTTGKVVWRAALKGIGEVSHSKYRNRVKLELGSDAITVQGEESSGSYVELVDPKTGKTLANELRPADADALESRH